MLHALITGLHIVVQGHRELEFQSHVLLETFCVLEVINKLHKMIWHYIYSNILK
jgi:uncharacterized membrane protein